ncbi:MAG: hypothetical protein JWP58_3321 [Hymenobacter sp.]|nr:hypothetical protein [Hymenobacter sp.]
MARKGVATKKAFRIGLGSNFDDYCINVNQSGISKLKFSVVHNRENKVVLDGFKLPLEYFQLICTAYYIAVRDFKKAFEDR